MKLKEISHWKTSKQMKLNEIVSTSTRSAPTIDMGAKKLFTASTQEEHLKAVNRLVDLLARDVLEAHLNGIELKLAIENSVLMIQADIKEKLFARIRTIIINRLENKDTDMKLNEIDGELPGTRDLPFEVLPARQLEVIRVLQPGGQGKYYIPLDDKKDWYLFSDGLVHPVNDIGKNRDVTPFFDDYNQAKRTLFKFIGWSTNSISD